MKTEDQGRVQENLPTIEEFKGPSIAELAYARTRTDGPELWAALAKAIGQAHSVEKDGFNSHQRYQYATAEGDEKIRLEREIKALGQDAIPEIVASLENTPIPVQIGAAKMLSTYRNKLVQELLLQMASRQEEPMEEEWILDDIGSEDTDNELIEVAFEMALEDQDEAVYLLRRIDRSGLNRDARDRIVERIVELLNHEDLKVQKIGLDLIGELEIEFPVRSLVKFLEHPQLKERALETLKRVTGKDFAYDMEKWNSYFEYQDGF